ncbi:Hypothetical Protein FCC1311_083532 [Hondaea fermentalgiana]|uniref:Uncharacterized protein n=1 Tax=Hondaea fermentalgiana TaxID=2315210 RepID=A0A2R5GQU4_9STRA|nr:Hypothetical Protein FCC1311_083532 [Hondaea fermentalgiana]|eukprot:GBG32128.1 Hypothetical Protein FCC1311_083532 [Hondaea fermentalgiana]
MDDKALSAAVAFDAASELHDEEEMTAESVLEALGQVEYKVRLLFTTTHHQKLVSKEERKQMLKDIESYQSFASEMEEVDPENAEAIMILAEKVLAILDGNAFLEDGKKKTLQSCLDHAEAAGWDALADEPWRAQLVAKAAKCSYAKAAAAVADELDLRRAIEIAPSMADGSARWSTVPAGFEPPKKH